MRHFGMMRPQNSNEALKRVQYFIQEFRRRALKVRDLDAVLKRRKFRSRRDTFYDRLWANASKDIGATVEKKYGMTRIQQGSLCTYVHHFDFMLDDNITTRLMADKSATYALIASRGHPVPQHCIFTLSDLKDAYALLANAPNGIVVKPASGTGGGNGVTVGIMTRDQLNSAARHAASFNSKILAEPILEGESVRLLYFKGIFLDAVLRGRPTVIGDGISTLRQLIRDETRNRLYREPIVALSPLCLDIDCRNQLRVQNLSLRSCPEKGRRVVVKRVVNENASRDNLSVRTSVHPEIIQAGSQIVSDLNVTLAGLDIMVKDLSASLSDSGVHFHEVNVGPGLHHHYLIANPDEGLPVASHILERMFSQQIGVLKV